MNEHADKIPESEKSNIQKEIENARGALNSDDASQMNSAYDRLTQEFHKLSQVLYQQASQQQAQPGADQPGAGQQQPPPPPPGSDSTPPPDDVVEGEYEDLGSSN